MNNNKMYYTILTDDLKKWLKETHQLLPLDQPFLDNNQIVLTKEILNNYSKWLFNLKNNPQ